MRYNRKDFERDAVAPLNAGSHARIVAYAREMESAETRLAALVAVLDAQWLERRCRCRCVRPSLRRWTCRGSPMRHRQIGRTTLVMLDALDYRAKTGNRVVYVIATRQSESYYRNLWFALGEEPKDIRFMTPHDSFEGILPECVFVDHYVWEHDSVGPSLTCEEECK